MKHFFSVITVFILSIAFSYGQKVTYDGKITDMDTEKSISGVTVRVMLNGTEVSSFTTSSNGNYSVQFPPGKVYTIAFSKSGYVTKIVKVDVVMVNEEEMPPGGKIFPPVPLDLFTDREGADFSFLETEAVVEWYFDRDRMIFDSGNVNRTKKKIADKLKEAEESAGQSEAQYNALIQEADKLYDDKTYEAALDKYVAALQIPGKQAEKHPNNRLIEIEALLQKKAEEDLAYQQENQAYLNVIAAADNFANNKEYDKAIAKYNEAIGLKSDEQYPKDKITELKEEQANANKKDAYDKVIAQADNFFKQNSLQAARDKYEEASKLLPKEAYPKSQLDLISGKLDAQSEVRDKKEKYNQAIADADALYNKEDYAAAIEKYKEAITFESAATYPVQRVEMAETKLAEQKAANENLEAFNLLVTQGDEEVTAKSFQNAVDKYNEALALIEDETVKTKRDTAQKSLEEEINKAEQENQIATLLASAEEKMGNKNYTGALADFEGVLAINAQNAKAIEGKSKAESLLAEKESIAAQQEQFNQLVAEGDELVKSTNYESAIVKYNEALGLSEDAPVKIKRDNAQKSLEQQNSKEAEKNQIATLLASAEEKMTDENYAGAIEDFQSVLTLNSKNPEAIEGKAKAASLLTEKQSNAAKVEAFDELVEQADQNFDSEKWNEAKTKYIAAKAIFNDKQHVNDRIEEIRSKLEKQNDQERIAEEIQVLLDQATTLKAKNEWSDVILKYEEALQLDDQRNDVQELLDAAKNSQKEWDAKQSKEAQFAQLKQEGNVLLAQKNWTEAKSKFEAALKIQDDTEIEVSLEIIETKLAEEALSEENEKAYQDKMDSAEELATNEKYEEALAAFKEALNLKENDVVAKSRIADMQQEISQLANQDEKNERYNAAIKSGNEAIDKKDYAAAIKFYDDALIEKPLDPEATRLKNNAKKLIKDLQSEEEQYMGLLQSGQEKYDGALSKNNDIPTLKEAKVIFEEAQNMRPKASLPQNKIVEIDELLRQIEEAKEKEGELAEINRQYEEQLDLASVAAQDFKYETAIDYLKAASLIKPEESFPRKKIKEYQALLDQISAANNKEKRYTDLINQADLAFDNKEYEESIDLYNDALTVKENEDYPNDQIEKAKKAISDLANNSDDKEYQNFIDKADEYFANKAYENALDSYQSALGAKDNDSYAKDKIDETQQILDDLKLKKEQNTLETEEFNKRIATADELFNQTNFIGAKKEYERALEIKGNDTYAIERAQLCVIKAKQKTDTGDDLRYQKILTKADEYFDDENFDKAINLYERALKLRNNDQYPKEKITEIKAIKNGNVKTESNVEYLGEESNISIMEGAALLEKGAKQREQLKQDAVQKRLRKNEGLAEERSATDYDERTAYENEITLIKDRIGATSIDEKENHRVFIDRVDNEIFEMELKNVQSNNFERGEVLRTNRNLVYINDAMADTRDKFTNDHTLTIEQIKDVREARDDQNIAEGAHNRVKLITTSEELIKLDIKHDEFAELNEEIRKDREVQIDEIEKGRELRSFEENNAEYNQVTNIQNDALLAEIKVTESTEDKLAINEQLQDDIYALDAAIQRKISKETDEAYQEQLLISSQYTAASDQFAETQEGKDDARQKALEQLKVIDQKAIEQSEVRSDRQYDETQQMVREVESVKNMNDEQALQQKKNLAAINEDVKAQESAMERANNIREQEEGIQRQNSVNELERIRKQEELTKEGKAENVRENYEDVKGLKASMESQGQLRDERSKNEKFKTQEMIDQLESNKLKFNETIANTLGDEYPEGVSQENYIRKDKDGIPVRIVTRRFVIKDGRGDVYIRIQSRNGLTYSKNGTPATEQTWINGTENAKLEKHY